MDKHAQTCADWARTGEPKTAYSGLFLTSNHFEPELTLRQLPRLLPPSASVSPTFASLLVPVPRLKDLIPMRPARPAQLKTPALARPMLLVTIMTTIARPPATTTPALSPSPSALSLPRLETMPLRLALASVPSWPSLLLWPSLYKRSNDMTKLGSDGVN